MVPRWGKGSRGCVKKMKTLRSTNWQLQNGDQDVNYSIRNLVNNIAKTIYDVMWVLDLPRGSLHKLNKCLIIILYT